MLPYFLPYLSLNVLGVLNRATNKIKAAPRIAIISIEGTVTSWCGIDPKLLSRSFLYFDSTRHPCREVNFVNFLLLWYLLGFNNLWISNRKCSESRPEKRFTQSKIPQLPWPFYALNSIMQWPEKLKQLYRRDLINFLYRWVLHRNNITEVAAMNSTRQQISF